MKSVVDVIMVTIPSDISSHRPLGRFAQLSHQLPLKFTSALQSRKTNHELITLPSKWNVKSMMIPSKTYEEIEFASKRKIQQSAAPIYIPMFQSIKRLTSMEKTKTRGKK